MHHNLILFLTCILLPGLAQLQDQTEQPLLEDTSDFLFNLNDTNFDQKVLSDESQGWFIMFYAPWCPHCHDAMPHFKELAETLKDQVNVGRVDCDSNYDLSQKYEIRGYPTFLYFYQGEIYQYEGERTIDAWTEFVTKGYKKEEPKEEEEPKDLEEESTPIDNQDIGAGKEEVYDMFKNENGTISLEDKLVQENNATLPSRENLPQEQNISQYPDLGQNMSNNETIEREDNVVLTPEERQRQENQTLFTDSPTEYQSTNEPNQTFPDNVTEYQNTNEPNQTLPRFGENNTEYQYNETISTPEQNFTQYQNVSQDLPQNENQTFPDVGDNTTEYQNNQTIPTLGENITQEQNISQDQSLPQNVSYNETDDVTLTPEERLRGDNQNYPGIGENTTEYSDNQTIATPSENITQDQNISQDLPQNENQTLPEARNNVTEPQNTTDQSQAFPGFIENTPEYQNNETIENSTQYQNISQDQNLPQNVSYNETDDVTLTPEERLRGDNQNYPGIGENNTEYPDNQTTITPSENITQDQNASQPQNLSEDLSENEDNSDTVTELTIDNFDSKVLSDENDRWFVMFYSSDCDLCKSILPLFQTLGKSLKDKVCLGKVDIDANPALRDRFSADEDPTFLYFHEGETRKFEGERNIASWTYFVNLGLEKAVDIKGDVSQRIGDAKDNITSTIDEKVRGQNLEFPGFGQNDTEYQYNETISRDNTTLSPEERPREENETPEQNVPQTPPNVEERYSPIKEFTSNDFDTEVLVDGKQRWLIMFYSPECPVCGTVMPMFEKLAESAPSKLNLGKANIETNPDLRDRFSIQGHPTIIYFHNGGTRRFESGERTMEVLNEFVEGLGSLDEKLDEIAESFKRDESDVTDVQEIEESPESVTELTEANFAEKVLPNDDRWFIMFYSPSCPHCKKAMPVFIELAKALKDQKDICIGRVNLDNNPELQTRYAINGHPTFLYIQNGEIRQYDGSRTVEAWTEFINKGYKKSEVVEEDQPKLIEEDTTHVETNEADDTHKNVIFPQGEQNDTNATDVVKERPPQQPIEEQIGADLPPAEPQPEIPATPEEPQVAPEPVEEPARFVKDLTSGDFDLDAGQKWFVMFYAPWCPHCKNAMPVFEELAQSLDGEINVGRVDCDANPEVLGKFSIQGYPTFIYFYNGERHNYEGERTVEQWTQFLNNDFTESRKEDAQEPETPSLIDEKSPEITEERADSVIDLTEGDFDSRVFSDDNSRWFVLFYAPWCPHCQHAMPAFNELAQAREGEINIARVNCVENQGLCARFGVQGYPTFLYFYKGETRQYEGERNVEAWTEFVNRGYVKEEVKADEEPKEVEKDMSPPEAEPEALPTPSTETAGASLVTLNNANFDQKVSGDQRWFIMFYAPWCPHCKHAMPDWEQFAKSVQDNVNVGIVDCQENNELRARFSVQGYPTFLYLYGGEKRQYEGPRTVEAWSAFVEEGFNKVEPKSITTTVSQNDNFSVIGWIVLGTGLGIGLLLVIYLGLSKKQEEPKYERPQVEEDSYVGGTAIDIDRY